MTRPRTSGAGPVRVGPRPGVAVWLARLVVLAAIVQAWRAVADRTKWTFVADAPAQAVDLARRMMPPDAGTVVDIARPLWDTVNVSILGTVAAVFLAVPIAFAAASNVARVPGLRPVALVAIATSRSVNSLVWALLWVAVVGPGLLAGVLAIALRSLGFVGKLLYEAIEEIDPAPVEAVRASGAGTLSVWAYGVVPQILPAFSGIAVFRWDINVREATVLGLVGAGGIGLELDAAVSALAWPKVATILLAIVAIVTISEALSARVRAAVT